MVPMVGPTNPTIDPTMNPTHKSYHTSYHVEETALFLRSLDAKHQERKKEKQKKPTNFITTSYLQKIHRIYKITSYIYIYKTTSDLDRDMFSSRSDDF